MLATRRTFTSGFAAALLATAAAATEPPRGGTLNFLVEAELPTLVTIAHTAGGAQRISPKVTEGLLTYDFDFNPQGVLATSWSVRPDGLEYAFELRQGVRWHDGHDFTSADVAFSLIFPVHPRTARGYLA
jgi:peptide/nickel transport system substrate-binding protein